jgi:hypothetical protein
MNRRLSMLFATLLFGLAGCTDGEPPGENAPAAPNVGGGAFDQPATGTIVGRVVWDGPLPEVPPFTVLHTAETPPRDGKRVRHEPNPFQPLIDAEGKGVQDAVIILRGIDPRRAGPWPHPPVRVELWQRTIRVVQGDVTSRVGFVRRGDDIEAVNRDPEYHSLRVRGAAFFTLPFVDAGKPSRKRLDQPGLVELTSGAGHGWMHAHLFVVEQPYYARTDRQGHFRIEQVPAGPCEVVCWLPSWVVAHQERDPESAQFSRIVFAPPVEQVAPVTIEPRVMSSVRFAWSVDQVPGSNDVGSRE